MLSSWIEMVLNFSNEYEIKNDKRIVNTTSSFIIFCSMVNIYDV